MTTGPPLERTEHERQFIYDSDMPRVKKISDQQVLDGALEVLTRRGPSDFTLPAVSQVVGLAPATLLQRFGSKAQLLEAALDRALALLEANTADLACGADPSEDLIAWVLRFTLALQTRRLLASQLELLARDIADARWRVRATRHMELFREGARAHLVRLGSGHPDRHASELEVLLHGLTVQWGIHGEGALDAWVERGVRTWLASWTQS